MMASQAVRPKKLGPHEAVADCAGCHGLCKMQECMELMAKARDGDVAGVQLLLSAGQAISVVDADGCSALHWASDRGQLKVCTRASGISAAFTF